MPATLQRLFFAVILRPLVLVVIGLSVRHRERLPASGPAILVANHNSHLDTVVLMTLYPGARLRHVRPVAAADYFLRSRALAWFARTIIGVIFISRHRQTNADPFADAIGALDRGEIIIVFPEGTRGEPERPSAFKKGMAHLAAARPETPITPIFMHGLGKALPKGSALLVPFMCDVVVGEPIRGADFGVDHVACMTALIARMTSLAAEREFAPWE